MDGEESYMNQQALYAFAVLYIGELAGGIVFGVVNDYIGNKNATIMNVIIAIMCFGATI